MVAMSLAGNGIVETRTPLSKVQGSRWGLEESKLVEAIHQGGHTPPSSSHPILLKVERAFDTHHSLLLCSQEWKAVTGSKTPSVFFTSFKQCFYACF